MTDFVEGIIAALEAKEKVALATVVNSKAPELLGRKLLVRSNGMVDGSLGTSLLDDRLVADCRQALAEPPFARAIFYALAAAESQALGVKSGTELEVFLEVLQPTETLLIVGAGHIALPLSRLGKTLGFEVAVIDDRLSFANRERFPEADQVIAGYYNQELARFPITPSTYIILVTRGHAQDEAALRQVINSDAVYIGMIGSKRRVAAVLRHMFEEGFPQEKVDQVYSPIGLDIGAETPEEIAVSILAEVINVRRRGSRHPASLSGRNRITKESLEDA